MTRKSKIARLPRSIRDELNHRLDKSQSGIRLVEWLNSLLEVKEILAKDFEGRRVTPQNLSEWKRGGYQDWLAHQERQSSLQDWLADAKELGEAASPEKLTEAIFTFVTVHYAAAMNDCWIDTPENRKNLEFWGCIVRDIVPLHQYDIARQRLELGEQKMDLDRQRLELDRQRLEFAQQKFVAQLQKSPNRSADIPVRSPACRGMTNQDARSVSNAGPASPSPLRNGDLSRLGSDERNVGEATGPRGPSERERVSQQGRGEEALRAPEKTSFDVRHSILDKHEINNTEQLPARPPAENPAKTPLIINALQPNPTKSNNSFLFFCKPQHRSLAP